MECYRHGFNDPDLVNFKCPTVNLKIQGDYQNSQHPAANRRPLKSPYPADFRIMYIAVMNVTFGSVLSFPFSNALVRTENIPVTESIKSELLT